MKILHITGARSWGGNEQQLLDTCIEFKRLNINHSIYCYKNSQIEKQALKNNIDIIISTSPKTFSIKKGFHLKKIIKNNKFDIIHLHTSDSVTTYVITDIFFNLKIPAVFSKKGMNSSKKKKLSIFKYNYKNIKYIICVSKAVFKSFKPTMKSKNQHKLTVVYDGINIDRIKPLEIDFPKLYNFDSKKLILGNIANHSRSKDLITLVKCANYLINKLNVKNIIFIQIGKKSKYSEEFMPLISKYKLEEYFIITGSLENASGYIHKFDAYVMSSEREGLPITIYEAFFQKTPVISTKAGGIPEAIENNINGMLSEVKDYKGLAENLASAIKNQKLTDLFCENSYDLVLKKFTSQQLAQNTLDVYKKSIA